MDASEAGAGTTVGKGIVAVLLAQTRDLARSGRLDEAAGLADRARSLDDGIEALDLLARIRAQQGRVGEATALWTEAERRDPENGAYRSALNRLTRLRGRPPWLVGVPLVAALSIIVLMVILAARVTSRLIERTRTVPGALTPSLEAERSTTEPHLPQVKLSVPGFAVSTEGDALLARFETGLFAHGTSLKPEASAALTEVARQLAPHWGSISVVIVGRTDSLRVRLDSPFRDNVELGLARATVVFELLRQVSPLPVAEVSLRTAEGAAPGGHPEYASARSRTAELWIAHRRATRAAQ